MSKPRRPKRVSFYDGTENDGGARVARWLRGRQAEQAGGAVILSGRGGSDDARLRRRTSMRRMLRSMKLEGVVTAALETSPGSFLVKMAPLRALLEAPATLVPRRANGTLPTVRQERGRRQRTRGVPPEAAVETRRILHALAVRTLDSLGVRRPGVEQVRREADRHYALLMRAAPAAEPTEAWLVQAVARALREYDEDSGTREPIRKAR